LYIITNISIIYMYNFTFFSLRDIISINGLTQIPTM
jgi:hypothetical protein